MKKRPIYFLTLIVYFSYTKVVESSCVLPLFWPHAHVMVNGMPRGNREVQEALGDARSAINGESSDGHSNRRRIINYDKRDR